MTETNRGSKFNIGLYTMISLRDILDQCNYHAFNARIGGYNTEHLKAWEQLLWNFYKEIRPKISINDSKKIRDKLLKLRTTPPTTGIKTTGPNEEDSIEVIDTRAFMRRWDLQRSIEARMRIYADDRGLLIPDKEADDTDEPENW